MKQTEWKYRYEITQALNFGLDHQKYRRIEDLIRSVKHFSNAQILLETWKYEKNNEQDFHIQILFKLLTKDMGESTK